MFNVSALLLDDALETATPLTNGVINKMLHSMTFHKIVINICISVYKKNVQAYSIVLCFKLILHSVL